MKGYIILFAILVACDSLVSYFQWIIPGSIIGLAMLFLFLIWRKKVSTELADASSTLLRYLPLCIVPVGAGFKDILINADQQLVLMLSVSVLALMFAVLITVGVFTLLQKNNSSKTGQEATQQSSL